jgi:co-chaperonin GroES (HSP10)
MSKHVKKVLGNHILVQQLVQGKQSMIALPDSTLQRSFLGVIKQVGTDLIDKVTLQPDMICLINPGSRQKGTRPGEWFVNEHDIYLIKKGASYNPYGPRILISRMNNVDVKVGSIIIPQCHQSSDQTYFGTVYSKGIVNGMTLRDVGLEIGDFVKVQKWDISIREIEIDEGAFLSVPLSLIEYVCDLKTVQDNFMVRS